MTLEHSGHKPTYELQYLNKKSEPFTVVRAGFLGKGNLGSVEAVSEVKQEIESPERKALKLYLSASGKEQLQKQTKTHRLFQILGIPTLEEFDAIETTDKRKIGLLMEDLSQKYSVILSTNSILEYRHGSDAHKQLIQTIDKKQLLAQLKKIALRAGLLGLTISDDAFFVLVENNGASRVIIGDLDAIHQFNPLKALQMNFEAIQNVARFPDQVLSTRKPTLYETDRSKNRHT